MHFLGHCKGHYGSRVTSYSVQVRPIQAALRAVLFRAVILLYFPGLKEEEERKRKRKKERLDKKEENSVHLVSFFFFA